MSVLPFNGTEFIEWATSFERIIKHFLSRRSPVVQNRIYTNDRLVIPNLERVLCAFRKSENTVARLLYQILANCLCAGSEVPPK